MAEKYHVFMIDIIGSAKVPDRDALSRTLDLAISRINAEYPYDYWAPLEVTKGDEVAGVLVSMARVYDMIDTLSQALYPVMFRCVLVFDQLDAGVDTRRSTVIDGPAFHRADQLMRGLKKTQKTFTLSSGEEELDAATEALVNFLLWRWNNLTELQRRIVRVYQQERNQSRVADILQRKQQQVQHTLDVCKWQLIDGAEKAVRGLFEIIDRRTRTGGMDGQ